MKWFEQQRIRHTLSHHPIPHAVWEKLMREADIFKGLSAVERAHLRELARTWSAGVAQEPPRSTYWFTMNLPLYSPTAPAAGRKPG